MSYVNKQPKKLKESRTNMGGHSIYPYIYGMDGPKYTVHTPSNLFDELPVSTTEDEATKATRNVKTGIKGQ